MGRYRNPFSAGLGLAAFVFLLAFFLTLSTLAGALVISVSAYLVLRVVSAINYEETKLSLWWWVCSYLLGSGIASGIPFVSPSLWEWILDTFGPTVGSTPFLSLFFGLVIGYIDVVSEDEPGGIWSRRLSFDGYNSAQKKKESFDVRTEYLEDSGELRATYVVKDKSYPQGRAEILVNGEVRHVFEPDSEGKTVRIEISEEDSVSVRKTYGY